MADDGVLSREIIVTEKWATVRTGTISRVTLTDGRTKYDVQVVDEGRRNPYVDKRFGHEEQAADFLYRKLMGTEVQD
jgi:hypothetical protein